MICVSIARGRHRHMIAEHRHLVQQGAQLVELRLDYINGEVNLKRLLADRPSPVVITCRRERDGGKWTGSEEQRLMLLRTAIAEGVEYVDLEDDVAGRSPAMARPSGSSACTTIARRPTTWRRSTPGWRRSTPDIVKLATTANGSHDNLRMLQLIRELEGAHRRYLHGRHRHAVADPGGPVRRAVHVRHVPSRADARAGPAQLPADDRDLSLRSHQLARRRVYGVIGDPIGHSLSPMVHNAAFPPAGHQRGLRAVSRAARAPGAVSRRCAGAGHQGAERHHSAQGGGAQEALGHMDASMQGIGAANTLMFERRQDRRATTPTTRRRSTAWSRRSPTITGRKASLDDQTALVLGAGGAAKAIAYGLEADGRTVVIAGRTVAAGPATGRRAEVQDGRLGQPLLGSARHHRQLHAGGHAPQRRRHAVRQASLAPLDGRVRHGLQSREYAAGQGRPQPELHGRHRRRDVRAPGLPAIQAVHRAGRPQRSDARRAQAGHRPGEVLSAYGFAGPRPTVDASWVNAPLTRMNLVLIGYRGTGKTTVARLLAERLGWPWFDADVEIEARAGKSIAQIFADDGEPAFRDWETQVVADLAAVASSRVLASGGRGRHAAGESRGHRKAGHGRLADRHPPETLWQRIQQTDHATGRGPNLTAAGRHNRDHRYARRAAARLSPVCRLRSRYRESRRPPKWPTLSLQQLPAARLTASGRTAEVSRPWTAILAIPLAAAADLSCLFLPWASAACRPA